MQKMCAPWKGENMKIDKITLKGKKKRYRLGMFFCVSMVAWGSMWIWNIWNKVPSNIHLRAGVEQGLEFYVPATATIYKNRRQVNVNLNQQIRFYGETEDTYTMKVELFGFIPFKQSEVSVIQEKKVKPIGSPVGIYVQTDGILVIDTGTFQAENGKKVSPAKNVLLRGDYICEINEKNIDSKSQLMEIIGNCNGEVLNLKVRRQKEYCNVVIEPQKDKKGEYKLGIWVRDNAQGIGTITFADENGNFGALGHGINDIDTTNIMEMKEGALYKADILSVTKGAKGSPGELTGVIAYSSRYKLGEIYQNTSNGVYGVLDQKVMGMEEEAVAIALKQEIRKGKAYILCTVSTEPEIFEVEITDVHLENENINRGLELKVTDEKLLEATGGIVQGMSGSPIIQDGKLVGAVTHVLVNDPTRGYGIFIENMLEEVNQAAGEQAKKDAS